MEQLGLKPPEPLKNTLICAPRTFERFSQPSVALSFKFKIGNLFGLKVVADHYCRGDRAYLLDNDGRVHTIIVEG